MVPEIREETVSTTFISYATAGSSFIKRTLHPSRLVRDRDGIPINRLWSEERILNEAAALKFISKRTTIPVPRLISYGKSDDGTMYLEVERILGIELNLVGDQCRMPKARAHTDHGPCDSCRGIAKGNAERFIENEVLPQLSLLRSDTTGLDGFVLPPPWVLEYDKRTHWATKTSAPREYVFCHGDLMDHNIMVHPETLHVLSIFDWEHAGFFPQAFQTWALEREEYFRLFTNKERLQELVTLLEP
ncbi:hypothetical protein CC80DRAFT_497724 [Byssothecium circinans]|uniref:Aminoglycoside phosphotransferase domain-containing protein n=1 Tax=Byssothecium circinans TaxID=147558 RepID=A0A6A5TA40_9PLEO|nr:hypothetical protein CC80DRAFT_497724 [Byssothecium circinans]